MKLIANDIYFNEVEKLLLEKKAVELYCRGSSMHPYLRGDGKDKIVISPFSPDELIPGEIILFRYHGKFICHRIIQRNGEILLIQGDGVHKNKERIRLSDVVGIVRTVIRPRSEPVSTHSTGARIYWRCWYLLRPVRRYLLAFYRLKLRIFRCSWKRDDIPDVGHTGDEHNQTCET